MVFNNTKVELTDELLIDIVRISKESFCDGLYVPCDEHPCGWDFISFDDIENPEEVLEYRFTDMNISNGIYACHKFENKTLEEILTETKCQFNFE